MGPRGDERYLHTFWHVAHCEAGRWSPNNTYKITNDAAADNMSIWCPDQLVYIGLSNAKHAGRAEW
jgi:hypothetical protein